MAGVDNGSEQAAMQHDGHLVHSSSHHGGSMNLAGADSGGHDCCKHRDDTSAPGCDSSSHCPSCPAGTVALAVSPQIVAGLPITFEPDVSGGQLLPAHVAPPYRPPTSLS